MAREELQQQIDAIHWYHEFDFDQGLVAQAMQLDKKVREKSLRWVLLEGPGHTTVRDDVPQEEVTKVLEELMIH